MPDFTSFPIAYKTIAPGDIPGGAGLPTPITFTLNPPMTGRLTMGAYTVAGPLAFAPVAAGAVNGAEVDVTLLPDGTNVPTFAGLLPFAGSGVYSQTNENLVVFAKSSGSGIFYGIQIGAAYSPPVAAPGVPALAAGATTSSSVSFTMAPGAGGAVVTYDTRYRLVGGTAYSAGPSVSSTGASTPATISGLPAGTAHEVQARATNSNSSSAYSATLTINTAVASFVSVTGAGASGAAFLGSAAQVGGVISQFAAGGSFSASGTATYNGSGEILLTASDVNGSVYKTAAVPPSADYEQFIDFVVAGGAYASSLRLINRTLPNAGVMLEMNPSLNTLRLRDVQLGGNLTGAVTLAPGMDGQLAAGPSTAANTVTLKIRSAGTTHTVSLKRWSDNFWLRPDNTYQATEVVAITGTSSTITAAGEPAIQNNTSSAGGTAGRVKNWQVKQ